MAPVAIDCGMRPGQGKSAVVLLHLLYGDLPSANGVALLAIRSQLPSVDVGVTVLTALTDVVEDWLNVTLGACDGFMHAAQRIPGPVVIEFRNSADGLPSIGSVAVLAGHVQIAVRTMRAPHGLRLAYHGHFDKRQK